MLLNASKELRNLRVTHLLFAIVILIQNAKAAYFQGCDHTFNLKDGHSYLESPYYPQRYPSGSSCRYKFVAPLDHSISVNCTIDLNKGRNGCSTETFYLARDGDKYLRDSEELCGKGTIIRKSLFSSVVLAYISKGSYGSFRCELFVQQQPCDCGWSANTKMVNAEEASVNEFPSMVALRNIKSRQKIYCGAVLISHRHLLTAAHCAYVERDPAFIEAQVGRHNLESASDTKYAAAYSISRIIVHPDYKSSSVQNDIAIFVTTENVEFSRGVGPICLPPLSNANNDFAYSYADIMGWGSLKFASNNSPTLQKANFMVIDHDTCSANFHNLDTIYPTQICTYDYSGNSRDSCQHDSGGPVIFRSTRQFLLGIVSFGNGCGASKYVTGVNTRVTSYLQWIYQNTGYSTCNVAM